MRLLISDANILIDMEAGALMETLFQLPMQFGIPDLLYYEEIEPGHQQGAGSRHGRYRAVMRHDRKPAAYSR
jgi:hypothetical protein